MNNQFNNRVLFILVGVLILIGAGWLVFTSLQRSGKVEVTFVGLPNDMTIHIDNTDLKPGSVYLEPGEKTYTADRDGFGPTEGTFTVSGKENAPQNTVFVSLAPHSAEGDEWLENNGRLVREFEAASGKNAREIGEYMRENNPIVAMLPITTPLYTIGYKSADDDGIIITVRAPEQYRQAALVYLASQDVRLSDYNFMFYDEEHPFKS